MSWDVLCKAPPHKHHDQCVALTCLLCCSNRSASKHTQLLKWDEKLMSTVKQHFCMSRWDSRHRDQGGALAATAGTCWVHKLSFCWCFVVVVQVDVRWPGDVWVLVLLMLLSRICRGCLQGFTSFEKSMFYNRHFHRVVACSMPEDNLFGFLKRLSMPYRILRGSGGSWPMIMSTI